MKNWSEEQIKCLRQKYSVLAWDEIERLLNKRKYAIRATARSLGLRRGYQPRKHISETNPERWKEIIKASSERMKNNNPSFYGSAIKSGLTKRKQRILKERLRFPKQEDYGYDIGYVYGVICGDGSLWKRIGYISLQATSYEFVKAFKVAVQNVFNLKTKIKQPNREKWNQSIVYEVIYCSRDIYEHILRDFEQRENTLTMVTKAPKMLFRKKEFARGFIAGLYDAEGTRPGSGQIGISNGSRTLLEQIQKVLSNYWSIQSSLLGPDKNCYTLNILGGKETSNCFLTLIESKIIYKRRLFKKGEREHASKRDFLVYSS